MKTRWLYMISFLFCIGCNKQPPASQLNETAQVSTVLLCKALWKCDSDARARGQVVSDLDFAIEESDECLANLQEQVEELGTCNSRIELVRGSFSTNIREIVRDVLSLSSSEGAVIFDLMTDIDRDLQKHCKGAEECHPLWQELGDDMEKFGSWLKFVKEEKLAVNGHMGELAQSIGSQLCNKNYSVSNEAWATFLKTRSRVAAKAAAFMQRRSGKSSQVAYCRNGYKRINLISERRRYGTEYFSNQECNDVFDAECIDE